MFSWGKTPETGLLAAVSLKRAVDVICAPGLCGEVALWGPLGRSLGPVGKGLSVVGGGVIRDVGEVSAQQAGVLAEGQASHIWGSRRRMSGAWEKLSPGLSQLLRLFLKLSMG